MNEPRATVKVEKVIKDAPIHTSVDPDTLDIIDEGAVRNRPGRPPRTKFNSELPASAEDEFANLLQDHTVKVHVDRVSPREWKQRPIAGMIEEFVPPSTQDEIETEIRNKFGGGRYRIRILKNGRFLAARGFTIYGDPIVVGSEEETSAVEEFDPSNFIPPPYLQRPSESGENLTRLKMQIEEERLKQQLDEVKGNGRKTTEIDSKFLLREQEEKLRNEYNSKIEISNIRSDMDKRFDQLISVIERNSKPEVDPEKDIKILTLKNEIDNLKNQFAGEIKNLSSDLKSMLKETATPKVDHTPELLKAIITGFSTMNSGSQSKMDSYVSAEQTKTEAILNSMKAINEANARVAAAQTDKLVTILQAQSQNRHDSIDNVAKVVGSVRDIAESMGFSPGSGTASPEEAQPQDMMTRIVGMVEKALPTLLASQKQAGRNLSEEEIKQIIIQNAEARARQLAPVYAAQFLKSQAAKQKQPSAQASAQSLPQTPPAQRSQSPHPQQPSPSVAPEVQPENQPNNLIPVEPSVKSETESGQEAVQPQQDPVYLDARERVNDCINMLLREVMIRPRKPEWTEMAFDELPDFILDKLVLVTNADELYEVIKPFADETITVQLLEHLKTSEKAVDWFVKGLNEIKIMYAEDNGGEDKD